jgi:hypothetical protein
MPRFAADSTLPLWAERLLRAGSLWINIAIIWETTDKAACHLDKVPGSSGLPRHAANESFEKGKIGTTALKVDR